MADADVQITAGSGTKIDTRTVGAGADEHRQVVVIGDPTTAANVAVVDATYGLQIMATRDQQFLSASSSGLTNTTYTSGDQLGTAITISNAARASGRGGVITSVVVLDVLGLIGPLDVFFFDQSITPTSADNAAVSITDADMANCIGVVQCVSTFSTAQNKLAQASNIALPYVCVGSTNLYALMVTRIANTGFSSATALTLSIVVERY